MKDSTAYNLLKIEEILRTGEEGMGQSSLEKLYELVDAMSSSYLGLYSHRKNCITGDHDHLLGQLREAFKNALSIDIIVSLWRRWVISLKRLKPTMMLRTNARFDSCERGDR